MDGSPSPDPRNLPRILDPLFRWVGHGTRRGDPEGCKFRYAVRLHFPSSNNIAEYEALISGLRIAIDIGVTRLYVYGDSKLEVNQVMKNSNCESPLMDAYC